jgi:hypothetical protein
MHEEDGVKKVIIITFAALAFLAGCGSAGNESSGIPVPPKWKGAPYRLAFGAAPAKSGPAGIAIPPINFTANPDMLETRANLVIEFDASGAKSQGPEMVQMVMGAVDIHGSDGSLPADYLSEASKDLATTLASHCIKGKTKIAVALTRSSIPLNATDDQINAHRLSDWTPIEVEFKNPHPKC